LKVGRPVAKQALDNKLGFVVSECPLAGDHIVQGMEKAANEPTGVEPVAHPIQIIARAYA
ncbi:MAG: glycerol-3-phosphate dehydrogenase, partial [Rhodospirillales bacterium]